MDLKGLCGSGFQKLFLRTELLRDTSCLYSVENLFYRKL